MRIAVLPFSVLRPDPQIDFLGFALADAIAGSLAGIPSLLVRSTMRAARLAAVQVDLAQVGTELGADVVVCGTILRAGGEVRVQAQLARVSDGALLWSDTAHGDAEHLLGLQANLAQGIVESLGVLLSPGDRKRLRSDMPVTARAYELYLRANHAGMQVWNWPEARELYHAALAEDPSYAPSWAGLGRCCRVIGKYSLTDEEAEASFAEAVHAFDQALALDAELPIVQNLYGQLEVEMGRPVDAAVRLLARIAHGKPDAELFAGLVHACRYCGLLDASIAAHHRARELDAHVPTSVANTYFLAGDYEAALVDRNVSDTEYQECLTLTMTGRADEALERIRDDDYDSARAESRPMLMSLHALLEGRRDDALAWLAKVTPGTRRDGEALYYVARHLSQLGESDEAYTTLSAAIDRGFLPLHALHADTWLDSVRAHSGFARLYARAAGRHRAAEIAFARAGGEAILRLLGDGAE